MGKLWQKNYRVNELVERFTVGTDYLLDRRLVAADCLASIAHGRGLAKLGVLSEAEFDAVRSGLVGILRESASGDFTVEAGDEDCHTAIENRLAAKLGEVGKKIHSGRSRNDQVIAALRVWVRSALTTLLREGVGLAEVLFSAAETNARVPMPGRTHMQIAMPSTAGLWFAAWAEEILDDLCLVNQSINLVNQSPLGAAASYGVPLPLDRQWVSDALGFSRLQNNVLYVNNSRGKFESVVLDALEQVSLTLGKMATDLILFSLPEFGYFRLPDELCTGSSIMPQKKNPDGLELLRAKAGIVGGLGAGVKNVIRSLPSGYNRDFQDTKEPLFRGIDIVRDSLALMRLTVENLAVDEVKLRGAFTPEIFATDAVYDRVASGASFREAYREVGRRLEAVGAGSPDELISKRTSAGAPGNLNLDLPRARLFALVTETEARAEVWAARYLALAGMEVDPAGV